MPAARAKRTTTGEDSVTEPETTAPDETQSTSAAPDDTQQPVEVQSGVRLEPDPNLPEPEPEKLAEGHYPDGHLTVEQAIHNAERLTGRPPWLVRVALRHHDVTDPLAVEDLRSKVDAFLSLEA